MAGSCRFALKVVVILIVPSVSSNFPESRNVEDIFGNVDNSTVETRQENSVKENRTDETTSVSEALSGEPFSQLTIAHVDLIEKIRVGEYLNKHEFCIMLYTDIIIDCLDRSKTLSLNEIMTTSSIEETLTSADSIEFSFFLDAINNDYKSTCLGCNLSTVICNLTFDFSSSSYINGLKRITWNLYISKSVLADLLNYLGNGTCLPNLTERDSVLLDRFINICDEVRDKRLNRLSSLPQEIYRHYALCQRCLLENDSLCQRCVLENDALCQRCMLENDALCQRCMLENEALYQRCVLENDSISISHIGCHALIKIPSTKMEYDLQFRTTEQSKVKTNETNVTVTSSSSFQNTDIRMKNGTRLKESCNGSDRIIVRDQCYNVSFSIVITRTFTFTVTPCFKDGFEYQVARYTNLTEAIYTGPLLNTTMCTKVHSEATNGDSPNKWTTFNHFRCTELIVPDHVATLLSLTQEDDHCLSSEFERYIVFVNMGSDVLTFTPHAVTYPVVIESRGCIQKEVEEQECCAAYKMSWKDGNLIKDFYHHLISWISNLLSALSGVGLSCRLALQNIVPCYMSYPGKIQFSLCLALLLSNILLLVGNVLAPSSLACQVVGVLKHFAFLVSLFWMNVNAFEIWRTFSHWSHQLRPRGYKCLILSSLYAVGVSAVIVIASLLVDHLIPDSDIAPMYGLKICWLHGKYSVALFFGFPCGMVSLANIVFVALTLRGLRRQRATMAEFKHVQRATTTDVSIVLKMVAMVGVTWLLALVATFVDAPAVYVIHAVCNASLGFLIAVVLVLNKRVLSAVRARYVCCYTKSKK